MPRRTEIKMLEDALSRRNPQQATDEQLATDLHWPIEKVGYVVERAELIPGSPVRRGRGRKIEFTGTESGDPLLYNDVTRILQKYWAPHRHLHSHQVGGGPIVVRDTSRAGHRDRSRWVHPDLVAEAMPKPRRSKTDKHDYHSFEVEPQGKFTLESIFQAFVQGRGSNYSWVIHHRSDMARDTDLDRVKWATKVTGVGLISYTQAGLWGTWKTDCRAIPRKPTARERGAFESAALQQYT